MRVLIVKDDVRMATAMRRGLQAEGVVADVATRGEDWVLDRFAHTVEAADLTRIDAHLEVLREAVVNADRKVAVDEARRLLKVTQAATHTT